MSLPLRCTRLLVVVAAALNLTSCKRSQPEPSRAPPPEPVAVKPSDAQVGPDTWYRIEVIADQHGRVPFFLGVETAADRGYVDNGDEHLEVIVIRREPLLVRIPVRGIEIQLEPDGATGRFKGKWLGEYYFKRDFDLVAERVPAPSPELLFPGTAAPIADLSGTWRVELESFGVGRASFRQGPGGVLGGSVVPPEVGDLRYLMGRVVGDKLKMSVFDGIHGFLVEATIAPDGSRLDGRWLIAGIGSFKLTATRDGAPELAKMMNARLVKGATRIDLPQLSQPPFRGNPVIVDYFGTWCPACIDLTPELARLHEQHAAAGLQVLSIALEPEADEHEQAEARRRIDEFKARFGVTWPIEVRFTDDYLAHLPKQLENVMGFPVSIWVRRDGTVAGLHTGFASEAVPEENRATIAKFRAWTEEIMSSPPAPEPKREPAR